MDVQFVKLIMACLLVVIACGIWCAIGWELRGYCDSVKYYHKRIMDVIAETEKLSEQTKQISERYGTWEGHKMSGE